MIRHTILLALTLAACGATATKAPTSSADCPPAAPPPLGAEIEVPPELWSCPPPPPAPKIPRTIEQVARWANEVVDGYEVCRSRLHRLENNLRKKPTYLRMEH